MMTPEQKRQKKEYDREYHRKRYTPEERERKRLKRLSDPNRKERERLKELSDKRKAWKIQWRLKHPEKSAEYSQKRRERLKHADPLYYRRYHYRVNFGITLEERDEIFSRNGGLCGICSQNVSTHLDHDHRTNKIRGALCKPCNQGLGFFRDSREILKEAIDYLEKTDQ